MRHIFLVVIFATLCINANAQMQKEHEDPASLEPKIYNIDNDKALEKYNALELDKTHKNLLDPANTSEGEIKKVYDSWKDFHQKIGEYIKVNNFSWGVDDPSIAIVNKIYFNASGEITHYAFKVLNPSVDADKKAEFAKVVEQFSNNVVIGLQRDNQFAQCGKTRYTNNN